MLQNKTLEFYNKNAEAFVEDTIDVGFMEIQDKFLSFLPDDGWILDFGCGSGRDTKYFLERGFHVDAVDGSEELCKIASRYTGTEVRQMLFSELDAVDRYDGIWACASILHLPKREQGAVLRKMAAALKVDGVIYTSFKYGEFEGERNGRFFTDFTVETFTDYIRGIERLQVEEYWITDDVRPGRGEEKWLNLILRKPDIH